MRSLALALILFGCSSSEPSASPASDASTDSGPTFCTFNDECAAGQRCDCSVNVEFACTCVAGPRGTGKAGVDSCTSANDCISGVCVEGTTGFVCSGRCRDGCGDKLPRCANIANLGEICVREPPVTPTGATGKFGSSTFEFAHAFFGYDYGDAGIVGTSIELHAGWSGGCPPPKTDPDGTIVIAGVPIPFVEKTHESGIKATLLGFDSALPIRSSATTAKVTIGALERCPTDVCAFQLGVSLVFAEGTVNGAVRATHCDSMDVR